MLYKSVNNYKIFFLWRHADKIVFHFANLKFKPELIQTSYMEKIIQRVEKWHFWSEHFVFKLKCELIQIFLWHLNLTL